jgi:hypothetical protein
MARFKRSGTDKSNLQKEEWVCWMRDKAASSNLHPFWFRLVQLRFNPMQSITARRKQYEGRNLTIFL